MKKIYIIFAFVLMTVFLNSCINLRVENPEIKYYDLTNEDDIAKTDRQIDCSLQIRTFSLVDKQGPERILVNESGIIKPLYYHRWIAGFDELVTDFIFIRFSKSEAFKQNLINSRSLLSPDYILEGTILENSVVNNPKSKEDEYYVKITLDIQLIKNDLNKSKLKSILNRKYTEKVNRKNEESQAISEAYNIAMKKISLRMLDDIVKTIENDK